MPEPKKKRSALALEVVRSPIEGDRDPNDPVERVYCGTRDTAIAVDDCRQCDEFVRAGVHAETGRTYVVCHGLTGQSTRTLRARRPRFFVSERLRVEASSLSERTPVSAVMRPDPALVSATVDVGHLRRVLASRRAEAAVVIDDHQAPIGVITRADLDRRDDRLLASAVLRPLDRVLAESASLSQAAAAFATHQLPVLPVSDASGRVVGTVAAFDVLRWIARTDGYRVGP